MYSPISIMKSSEHFYQVSDHPETRQLLEQIDSRQVALKARSEGGAALWEAAQHKLRVSWTYDSNAIEGSTLTYGETLFFLNEGLTVEGKPLKDFLDARNHHEAILLLDDFITQRRQISEGFIKEINALIVQGITHTDAINQAGERVKKPLKGGEYKTLPNHVLQPDQTIHRYVEPEHVATEMAFLCDWISSHPAIHPVIVSAIAHYNMVRIHPFDDGNGRGARLLMNLILMQQHYVPAIIRNEYRRHYLETIRQADKGDLQPFIQFIAKSLLETQETMLSDTKENRYK